MIFEVELVGIETDTGSAPHVTLGGEQSSREAKFKVQLANCCGCWADHRYRRQTFQRTVPTDGCSR